MPNPYLLKNGIFYLTHKWVKKEVPTFPNGVSPKVKIIARLEFELALYGVAVQDVSDDTTGTSPGRIRPSKSILN